MVACGKFNKPNKEPKRYHFLTVKLIQALQESRMSCQLELPVAADLAINFECELAMIGTFNFLMQSIKTTSFM